MSRPTDATAHSNSCAPTVHRRSAPIAAGTPFGWRRTEARDSPRQPRRQMATNQGGRRCRSTRACRLPSADDLNPQAREMADESMVRTLAAQADAIWPQERWLFERYHLPEDATSLDAGCGT